MTDTRDERIHAIVYSNDSREELGERIVALEDENAKLQERVEWLDGECRKSMGMSHKFFEMIGEYQKENAKLRELACHMWGWLTAPSVSGAALHDISGQMRELGVEVSE